MLQIPDSSPGAGLAGWSGGSSQGRPEQFQYSEAGLHPNYIPIK